MSKIIKISPLTRIEGHLSVHTEAEPDGDAFRIREAQCEGEMFRGFEVLLRGRDPLDAQQITQRICGVCPISHGIASCRAQEQAYGIKPTRNGRLLQNLILAANYLQSHIMHFYHLAALDFVDVTAVLSYEGKDYALNSLKAWIQNALSSKDILPAAPFLPRYEVPYISSAEVNWQLLTHYVDALSIRRQCHEAAAVFGAKIPHSTAIFPGGCAQAPTIERIVAYESRMRAMEHFITDIYFDDVLAAAKAYPEYFDLGKGYGDLLAFGAFEVEDNMTRKLFEPAVVIDGKWEKPDIAAITEDVSHSWFTNSSGGHPSRGHTEAAPGRAGAYTWLKAPRYRGRPMEVGPTARVLGAYRAPGDSTVKGQITAVLKQLELPAEKLCSVMGRHLCRALECKILMQAAREWINELQPDAPPLTDFEPVKSGSGVGLTEAPRGALGHWITISDYRIENYQCVVPTTWNMSPRDAEGKPGPIEKSLENLVVKDPDQPIEVARVVRSFDPCLACAVH